MQLKLLCVSPHLGVYLWLRKELEAWVKKKMDLWYHGFHKLGKISKRHPQSSYDRLGMSFQL